MCPLPHSELDDYRIMQESPMKDSQNRFTNPLDWWKGHKEEFPLLASLARRVLSISATSVPSERVFSKSGWIMNKRRLPLQHHLLQPGCSCLQCFLPQRSASFISKLGLDENENRTFFSYPSSIESCLSYLMNVGFTRNRPKIEG
jgi:hypothetical protein